MLAREQRRQLRRHNAEQNVRTIAVYLMSGWTALTAAVRLVPAAWPHAAWAVVVVVGTVGAALLAAWLTGGLRKAGVPDER